MKLADLKKSIEPLAKAKADTTKMVRVEIDLEKAASALLHEPANEIEKASDDADADEMAKRIVGRIDAIEALLSKADEDDDGRVYVSVKEDDELAKEFSVDKADDTDDTGADDGTKTGKTGGEVETSKSDDDDDVSWPNDLAGKASRVRKLTKGEVVTSTDPSERRSVRTEKRDRKRSRERCMK